MARPQPLRRTTKKKKVEEVERKVFCAGRQLLKSVIWRRKCWWWRKQNYVSAVWVNDVNARGVGHLLDVKQDDKLDDIDEGQQRAKQGPHPDHSLSVNQAQHVGGNHKLLPPKGLDQLVGHVVHQNSQVKEQQQVSPAVQSLPVWRSLWRPSGWYLRGNSTRTSTATLIRRSNSVSLYISWPMRVSQHCVTRWEGQGRFFFVLVAQCQAVFPSHQTLVYFKSLFVVVAFLRMRAHNNLAICVFVI